MFYLFNSGSREAYRTNVLDTLFVPCGMHMVYQYSVVGAVQHVSSLCSLRIRHAKRGSPVLVSFIDRYGTDGYVYHPLRLGSLAEAEIEGGRLMVDVCLGEFVYPRDLAEFGHVCSSALKGIACLTQNSPEHENDGHYVVDGDDIITPVRPLNGDEAWGAATRALACTRAFRATGLGDRTVFIRVRVEGATKLKGRKGREKAGTTNGITLTRGERYSLSITYSYPAQAQRLPEDRFPTLEVRLGDGLRAIGATSVPIAAAGETVKLHFSVSRHDDQNAGAIGFVVTHPTPLMRLQAPGKTLVARLRQPGLHLVKAGGLFLAFFLLQAVMHIDPVGAKPLTLGPYEVHANLAKASISALQTLVLMGLIGLFGRKPF